MVWKAAMDRVSGLQHVNKVAGKLAMICGLNVCHELRVYQRGFWLLLRVRDGIIC